MTTEPNAGLCEFELKVLRECAGEPQPDLSWGAAMSAALETLKSRGLVERSRRFYVATEAGLKQLALASAGLMRQGCCDDY